MDNTNLIERNEEEQKRAVELYDSFRDELLKRQLSNTENYDKTILSLSSAGLALSLSFFKFVVPIKMASYLWLIVGSWGAFLLTIISSLIAYLISNRAIDHQLDIATDYYINKKASAATEKNKLSIWNNRLNYLVAFSFSIAIIMMVIFVMLNINKEGSKMSKKETLVSVSDIDPKSKPCLESATIPIMQKVPTFDSATIPTMQAAPGTTAAQKEAESVNTNNNSSDNSSSE